MLKTRKAKTLVFAVIVLLAMLFLSIGISKIQLQDGKPVNLGDASIQGGSYGALFDGGFIFYLLYAFYAISALALVILIVYMLLTPERRRQLLKIILRVLPIVVIAFFLINAVHSCSSNVSQPLQLQPGIRPTPEVSSIPKSTFTPTLTPGVIVAASIILALIVAVVAALLIIRFRQASVRQTTPLMRLGDKAQEALDNLRAGGDLKDAVLRCYYEMSRILVEQRNLKRSRSMTPHEFEALLVADGLPGEPVQQLTHLFEEVRYGMKKTGEREEWIAVSSLSAIVDACKVAR